MAQVCYANRLAEVWKFDTTTGRLTHRMDDVRVDGIPVISPDSTLAAFVGEDQKLRIWDLTTAEIRLIIEDQKECGFAFSPDSTRVASTTLDGVIQVWNLATKDAEQTLPGNYKVPNDLDVLFSPNGTEIATRHYRR